MKELKKTDIKQEVFDLYDAYAHNRIDAFTVENKYPVPNTFTAAKQELISGNIKWNSLFHLPKSFEAQITAIYLAPDIIPQGKIAARYSLDFGIKKAVQKGKGELFLNVTDILNTLVMPISRVFPLNSLIRLRDCFK